MKNSAKIIASAMLVMVVVSLILTFFVPTHTGEIRQELREGDFIIQEYGQPHSAMTEYELRIIGFDEDGNPLVTNSFGSVITMTAEEFLDILQFPYDTEDCTIIGYSKLDTGFGNRFCVVYEFGDYTYWVGEHDIIYKYSYGDTFWNLMDTSLIIT